MLFVMAALAAAGAGIGLWLMLRRPWGGFATFGAVAHAHALAQATSIGVFIPEAFDV